MEKFIVQNQQSAIRLDKAIRLQFPEWGRSAINQNITAKTITVNGKSVWLGSWKVSNGDVIEIANPPEPQKSEIISFDPKWLIAKEHGLIVINKPSGLRVHATSAGGENNLLDIARNELGAVSLLHRLDRDTSGVILLSEEGAEINAHIDDLLKSRQIKKWYLAVCNKSKSRLNTDGDLRHYLAPQKKRKDWMEVVERGGKYAHTQYKIIVENADMQLVLIAPKTGRTHQLRVQLADLDAPIIGDKIYGKRNEGKRLMLHAWHIEIPENENFPSLSYKAEIPTDFKSQLPAEFVDQIRKLNPSEEEFNERAE